MKLLTGLMMAASLTAAALAGATAAQAADKFVVGYTNFNDSDVFPYLVKNTFQEVAKGDPDLEVLFADANLDISKQLDQIDNFIAQKVNVIVTVPADYEGIVPGVEAANRAGIPVISLNIASAGGDFTFVGSKNYDAGKLQGEFMKEHLPQDAKILYLQGTPGLYHSVERLQGFTDACLKERPDVTLLASLSGNYDRSQGMKITEDWVQSFPQFDAIIAANDQMALGALEALKTSGRLQGVMISGIDGTADALKAIKAGEMAQSIFQNAEEQARSAYDIVELIKAGQPAPKEKIVPFESITADNVDNYLK